jgi:hypothetical protein
MFARLSSSVLFVPSKTILLGVTKRLPCATAADKKLIENIIETAVYPITCL